MRLVWDDDDIIEAYTEAIASGSKHPNVDVGERAGLSPGAVSQRLMRLRRTGRIPEDLNWRETANIRCCPHCGAAPHAQHPGRARLLAQRREAESGRAVSR